MRRVIVGVVEPGDLINFTINQLDRRPWCLVLSKLSYGVNGTTVCFLQFDKVETSTIRDTRVVEVIKGTAK